jgi:hypothetical protein
MAGPDGSAVRLSIVRRTVRVNLFWNILWIIGDRVVRESDRSLAGA